MSNRRCRRQRRGRHCRAAFGVARRRGRAGDAPLGPPSDSRPQDDPEALSALRARPGARWGLQGLFVRRRIIRLFNCVIEITLLCQATVLSLSAAFEETRGGAETGLFAVGTGVHRFAAIIFCRIASRYEALPVMGR